MMLTKDAKSPYVDFDYYRDVYYGTLMKADSFKRAEMEAEAFVDAVTFSRIGNLKEIPDCVKNAICSAAEEMHRYLESRKSQITSESNDGYSVTYASAVSDSSCRKAMELKVKRWLAGTGLMYKGWSKEYDEKR
ncbi:MAG: hypothetical protein ACI4EO_01630 [Blautia sp.]